jgi:hypothetical protein
MSDAAEEPATEPAAPQQLAKVVVMFKATGDAPILKQNKFKARAPATGSGGAAAGAATQAADRGCDALGCRPLLLRSRADIRDGAVR